MICLYSIVSVRLPTRKPSMISHDTSREENASARTEEKTDMYLGCEHCLQRNEGCNQQQRRHHSMGKKSKFYAVGVGRRTGIYMSWAECEAQVCAAAGEDDKQQRRLPHSFCLCFCFRYNRSRVSRAPNSNPLRLGKKHKPLYNPVLLLLLLPRRVMLTKILSLPIRSVALKSRIQT